MLLCRAGELTALWKAAGLRNAREQPIDVTTRFASFADYWDPFLLGQGPAGAYVRGVEAAKLTALRAEVTRRLGVGSEERPLSLGARVGAVRGYVP